MRYRGFFEHDRLFAEECSMSWFSLVEQTLDILDLTVQNLQLADANELAAHHYPNLSTDRPALIGPLTDPALCRRLSLLLRQAYSEDHGCIVVCGVDTDRPTVYRVALENIENAPLSGIALLYLPSLSCPGAVETFQATVARLRAPDGCPWDREQTHRSLRQGFLEESYEALDALDRGDMELLQEELGDVLLHILLQAQIASEQGEFRMSDVVCAVNRKIVYRHPHVFDGVVVEGVDQVLTNWEELKRKEKGERALAPSPFEGIPPSMPALARSQAMLRRAARLNVLPAPEGEIEATFKLAGLLADQMEVSDKVRFLGDLLFDLVCLGDKMGIDAESALREANLHFERRSSRVLRPPSDVSAEEN
jgi:tetrapyrrole methylase family protein/MazG family protein